MILLGGFGRSARTRGWAVLDGLRSKELITQIFFSADCLIDDKIILCGLCEA